MDDKENKAKDEKRIVWLTGTSHGASKDSTPQKKEAGNG